MGNMGLVGDFLVNFEYFSFGIVGFFGNCWEIVGLDPSDSNFTHYFAKTLAPTPFVDFAQMHFAIAQKLYFGFADHRVGLIG